MATPSLMQNKAKNFAVNVTGSLADGYRWISFAIIGRLGTAGATGIPLSIAARPSTLSGRPDDLCNMSRCASGSGGGG